MNIKQVTLEQYNNKNYKSGNKYKKIVWYFINIFMFKTSLPFPSRLKVFILKLFGAKVGKDIVIKPNVNIKYPWFLTIGDNCWIGEEVWIDNLANVKIGHNVCLSQGSYILTGSHNYKKETFDLMLGEIMLEDGVWIGAKSIVCPNVVCKTQSVLSVGSVATSNLEPYFIYQGNPAIKKRKRNIQ